MKQPSTRSLQRLLRPQSIALFGSAWANNVAEQLRQAGYQGQLFAVHPQRQSLANLPSYASVAELPIAPDACFVGVNRTATVAVIKALAERGAGGAICFASGFKESDWVDGAELQEALVEAAGDMPILGPNCYGYINYLDKTPLWPDQHGGHPVARGAAIIAQSSNIAINMTMQKRGLNLSFMVTLGNQAQTQVSDLIDTLVDDPQVTCIGLYLEGFGDIERFVAAAERAKLANKPLVAIKVGKSAKASAATKTHTASLASSAGAASALLARLGIVEVDAISVFLETLKLLDQCGPLQHNRLASVSCSGGEASLMSDLAQGTCIDYADFSDQTRQELKMVLGEHVTLANPLDYHTYIWGNLPAMQQCFAAVLRAPFAAHLFVLDVPRADRCNPRGHDCAIEAICAAVKLVRQTVPDVHVIVLSNLPENLECDVVERFYDAGITTLHGMETGIAALHAAIRAGDYARQHIGAQPIVSLVKPVGQSLQQKGTKILTEDEAKRALAQAGLECPRRISATSLKELLVKSVSVPKPWVLKVLGLAHKSEQGGVLLNIKSTAELRDKFAHLPSTAQGYLLEEYIEASLAELIVGVYKDDSGLLVLTLGAGGIYTEVLNDTAQLLLPVTSEDIEAALKSLKVGQILKGLRGQPEANWPAIIAAIQAVASYAQHQVDHVASLDVNPLLITTERAIAVDALIELYE